MGQGDVIETLPDARASLNGDIQSEPSKKVSFGSIMTYDEIHDDKKGLVISFRKKEGPIYSTKLSSKEKNRKS